MENKNIKTKKSTTYEIFVFSNQHGKQRQFNISKKAVQMTIGFGSLGLIALIALSFYLFKDMVSDARNNDQSSKLLVKAEKLEADNDYLWATTSELERRLNDFQDKADKLALMVGMEPTGSDDGIGGPDLFGAPYDDYNRPDLGFLQRGVVTLEERLNTLEDAFSNQRDRLDATPSVIPARGWISSGFKHRIDPFTKERTWHNGIDVSAQRGTPIYAPAKGVVTFKGYNGGFGNSLVINHGNDLTTRYAHLDRFNVSKGQRVNRGDLIGYVGSTGRSTAPHLHYEIHKGDKSVDPMKYIIRNDH